MSLYFYFTQTARGSQISCFCLASSPPVFFDSSMYPRPAFHASRFPTARFCSVSEQIVSRRRGNRFTDSPIVLQFHVRRDYLLRRKNPKKVISKVKFFTYIATRRRRHWYRLVGLTKLVAASNSRAPVAWLSPSLKLFYRRRSGHEISRRARKTLSLKVDVFRFGWQSKRVNGVASAAKC